MTTWTLILRNLRFHSRAHLGVLVGAAIGSAALVGALVVGDSVKLSLRDMALARLGRVETALDANDRFFRADLAISSSKEGPKPAAALMLRGTASSDNASARANRVQVLGVDSAFWQLAQQPPQLGEIPADSVVMNEALAAQLHARPGDTILLRIQKPSLLSRDAPLTPQEDYSVALRLKLKSIVNDKELGRFGLQANQVAPYNAFVNRGVLQEKVGEPGRANLLLVPELPREKSATASGASGFPAALPEGANAAQAADEVLQKKWQLADAELDLRTLPGNGALELRSDRVFVDPAVVDAAKKIVPKSQAILTYFVNELSVGDRSTPYSMVTAMEGDPVPEGLNDGEIVINQWLADDLQAKPGETLKLTYFVMGSGRALMEQHDEFKIQGIVPLTGAAADRTLMPDFPGLAKAESSKDWDAGFPIQLSRIREKDEQYWHDHRGTPKAFITPAAGRRMWSNRFGDTTALRFPAGEISRDDLRNKLLAALKPADIGLSFQPVREQALAASTQGMDFGGLFVGFSFFLIAAALLLMALLFQFGLERRATEIGTLLALGFRPRQVRRLLMGEGLMLSLAGGVLGALGGVYYARAMLHGLTTVWVDAVGTSALEYHATPMTIAMGVITGTLVAAFTIWLALRRQAAQPARELLSEGAVEHSWRTAAAKKKRRWSGWIAWICALMALATIADALWKEEHASPDTFFSAGALLLISGIAFASSWLGRLAQRQSTVPPAMIVAGSGTNPPAERPPIGLSLGGLGMRSCARRRKRSLATIGLLACGVFLIAAIGAFRLDANHNAGMRSSGTGGFALIGQSALPVTYDLNSQAGRDFYGLNPKEIADVSVVSFKVRDGDDASCLNLNRAQKPRLIGVNPDALQQRHSFTFTKVDKGTTDSRAWQLLRRQNYGGNPPLAQDEVPAIGDENSILWALGKKVGDTIDYTDERGRPFKLKIVGSIANSILQGNLIIDEAEFVKRFPGESGFRMFLIDVPSKSVAGVSAVMTRALQDAGLELTTAPARLAEFNAVQNTYLSTFQVLGGLGLLLGSAGLGIVVLRNVQERRGELGLMLALGFRRPSLQWLVLSEHGVLLGLGLAVGIAAAAIGVLPALISPGSHIPYGSLGLTLTGIVANGMIWAWLATKAALRGRLLSALRNE